MIQFLRMITLYQAIFALDMYLLYWWTNILLQYVRCVYNIVLLSLRIGAVQCYSEVATYREWNKLW